MCQRHTSQLQLLPLLYYNYVYYYRCAARTSFLSLKKKKEKNPLASFSSDEPNDRVCFILFSVSLSASVSFLTLFAKSSPRRGGTDETAKGEFTLTRKFPGCFSAFLPLSLFLCIFFPVPPTTTCSLLSRSRRADSRRKIERKSEFRLFRCRRRIFTSGTFANRAARPSCAKCGSYFIDMCARLSFAPRRSEMSCACR